VPMPVDVEALDRTLIREEVYATLLEWIIDGTLEPGERLRDYDLAARLGTSRMPIREALRRLEDEGLVEAAANRWTRVSALDECTAQNIFPLLCSLEPLAMRLAGPNVTRADRDGMTAANAAFKRALETDNAAQASVADAAFHNAFVERAGNPDLMRFVRELWLKVRRLEIGGGGAWLFNGDAVVEHERILSEMDEGNYQAASALVAAHWRRSLARANKSTSRVSDEASTSAAAS
jgi:DNA-binding GntR family transcriptional regulator